MSTSDHGDPAPDGTSAGGIGYAAALAELERILTELEAVDVDVDVLAERVQRAAVLIRACRERISEARLQIEQVVGELGP